MTPEWLGLLAELVFISRDGLPKNGNPLTRVVMFIAPLNDQTLEHENFTHIRFVRLHSDEQRAGMDVHCRSGWL